MKKSLLYTRTGDAGHTSLVGGTRIPKNSPRVAAYGDLDELNAHLGILRAHIDQMQYTPAQALLATVQATLFDLGAYLATPSVTIGEASLLPPSERPAPAITPDDILTLERAIDTLDATLPPQRTFILPGGTLAAAHAHLARTVCRRAERTILTLIDTDQYVHPSLLQYINRLSDYLFILARALNAAASHPDIPWLPRK